MLYKKTVVIWATTERELLDAANNAVAAAKAIGDVAAFGLGQENYAVANPESDPDYCETVEDLYDDEPEQYVEVAAGEHAHRYSETTCPDCNADLTEPESITIEATANDGTSMGQHLTALDLDGNLIDVNGIIANGQHAGTTCTVCKSALDDLEV